MAITEHTRRVLWGQSGGRCAKCRRALIEPATRHDREALVGQECHVISAAASGPRHGPAPLGGYDALDNLLLLCGVCHRVVDAQPASFAVVDLQKMKAEHERWVAQRTKAGSLPGFNFSFTPIPDGLELSLVASGGQLVALISGTQDLATDHDPPRSDEDAELIASVFDRLGDADVELDAGGPGASVRLAREFQRLITEDLLPSGIVLYGAVANRQLVVDGVGALWRSCVVTARYAPRAQHGPRDRRRATEIGLVAVLQDLLAKGRPLPASARISSDGTSARIEMWEQEVVATFEKAGRADLVIRFETRDPYEFGRSLVSGVWRTRARMKRELLILSDLVAELARA